MKRKILSFFMVTILLLITVSVGFIANSESKNLILNGDFKEHSNNIPANWNLILKSNTTAEVVENVTIPNGITTNAVKFTTTASNTQRSSLYYTNKIKIERNTTYTTTFWVKSKGISGFRTYMYEPTYIDTSGKQKTSKNAIEGQNIYTYTYDSGSTRIIRTDIKHSWTIAHTGIDIDASSYASMFVCRKNGAPLIPTPDYPNQEKSGEWVQIKHTFTTGDDTAHMAEVSYDFALPEVVNGEFWIANVVMTAEGDSVDTPDAPENPNTDSLEDYANGTLLAQTTHKKDISATDTDWTETSYLNTTKDGKGVYYLDCTYAGTFRKASITTATARTGKNSILFSAPYGYLGRKFTGLEKNTLYTISFYAKGDSSTQFGDLIVTNPNMTIFNTNGSIKSNENFIARSTNRYTAGDTWSEATITFNSGDNTEVMLWAIQQGNKNLYIDDFSINSVPVPFKPAVNNANLGTVSPATEIECTKGQSVTVTANPDVNVTFVGWYIGEELISKDCEFTFEYSNDYQNLTAVFESIPGTIPNNGLEHYENGQILASYDKDNTPQFNNTPPWYVDTTYRTSDTALNLKITNTLYHSGEKSAMIIMPYRYIGMDVENLKPNTEYILSFYAHITGKEAPSYMDQNPKSVTNAFILPKGKAAIVETVTSSGTVRYTTVPTSEYIGSIPKQIECYNEWKKIEIPFTTTSDITDITLWLTFSGYQAKLYMDDFSVYEYVTVDCKAERGGDVKVNCDSKNIPIGKVVTVEATPYAGNTFIGWRDTSGKLISTSTKYTFTASKDFTLIAWFDGNNMPEMDIFTTENYDGTFENGGIDDWYFEDTQSGFDAQWCNALRTTDYAYQGSYSLALNSRYRDTILPLNNILAHTNYTLSFYIKFGTLVENPAVSYAAVLPYNKTNPNASNKVFASADTITPSQEWQKVELNFNSESCTNLKFMLRYTIDNPQARIYIDNLSLVCKDYTGPDRNAFFTPGNINGDTTNNVNLLDLITIAQYMAGWENLTVDTKALDVNGDSLVDLEDLTALSRFLAGWDDVKLSISPYVFYSN